MSENYLQQDDYARRKSDRLDLWIEDWAEGENMVVCIHHCWDDDGDYLGTDTLLCHEDDLEMIYPVLSAQEQRD